MDYSLTLNLPKTKFPMKANLVQKELELIEFWEQNRIYEKMMNRRADNGSFILHDGPPYANGHIHIGHAFNKILKDIIIRSKNMTGFQASYIPGWDCHGLPIEHEVDKKLGPKKQQLSTYEIRKLCREYAKKFVDIQKKEFQRLGVFGDWDHPYLTMDPEYESAIVREFGRLAASGGVYRGLKPVYWCSFCQTALAEAEVEYADHTSPSIWVKFPVRSGFREKFPDLANQASKCSVLIWTTTPWTLPANLAIAVNPDYEYAACQVDDEVWLMAKDLVERTMNVAKISEYQILKTFAGGALLGIISQHPFYERESPIVPAAYVTLDQGTGCVHIAPGHGQEDYEVGQRHGFSPYAPVNQEGKFTSEVQYFAGVPIFKANPEIIRLMREQGTLIFEETVVHSYPHCWRCKNPVIFRATEQWFISMEKNDLRAKALEQIRQVRWIPRWGENRISSMVSDRPDWCISRQRSWGVPIVVFFCSSCQYPIMDREVIEHVADLVAKEGIDIWFQREPKELLPDGFTCPRCQGAEFTKDMNILDVWFESGVSFAAVLEKRPSLRFPADLYLEGSDQHRGWFQSSLLTSVGTRGLPPYRSVLTHGFVVDGEGKKMSKSAGNVIAPQEVIEKLGADILRLWVCSEDYKDDIRICNDLLRRLSDAYRRIRNTCRYLLSNLEDFDPQTDRVPFDQMEEMDRWILHRFQELIARVRKAYEDYEFHILFHGLHNFCTVDLSSFYLDASKDRMYTRGKSSLGRRSGQTAMYEIILGMVKLMAPVLCFTAEEIWKYLPGSKDLPESVHLASLPDPKAEYLDSDLAERWETLLQVRAEVAKVLEAARAAKVIGHSLDAQVSLILTDPKLYDFLKKYADLLPTIFITSSTTLEQTESAPSDAEGYTRSGLFDQLFIKVTHAEGEKCARCWKYSPLVGKTAEYPDLCATCVSVLKSMPDQPSKELQPAVEQGESSR
ncbi:MAG: isoleucine--tRNA ligase [bacterium]|nr:isoleucine--tRNA ligase [bacterium]